MVRVGSGGPPRGSGGVGRPTQRTGKGREAHSVVQEGSGGQPGRPGGFGRVTRRAGWGLEAHPVGR